MHTDTWTRNGRERGRGLDVDVEVSFVGVAWAWAYRAYGRGCGRTVRTGVGVGVLWAWLKTRYQWTFVSQDGFISIMNYQAVETIFLSLVPETRTHSKRLFTSQVSNLKLATARFRSVQIFSTAGPQQIRFV